MAAPPPSALTTVEVDVVSDPNWYWAWPAKRRLERAAAEAGVSLTLRFQPFQLYPHLPGHTDRHDDGAQGPPQETTEGKVAAASATTQTVSPATASPATTLPGVDKGAFFLRNSKRVRPDETDEMRTRRRQRVVEAWAEEGLSLSDVYGSLDGARVGNSFDAQRLILFARRRNKEDAVIEAVYAANHERGECLGDRSVLQAAAERAGLPGDDVRAMLESSEGVEEVQEKIEEYRRMGVNAVPVVILEGRFMINGYPEVGMLAAAFKQLAETGSIDGALL